MDVPVYYLSLANEDGFVGAVLVEAAAMLVSGLMECMGCEIPAGYRPQPSSEKFGRLVGIDEIKALDSDGVAVKVRSDGSKVGEV